MKTTKETRLKALVDQLDPWQKEVRNTKGNLVLRSGRQVGKSHTIGLKAAEYALDNEKRLVMVVSKTEKQAALLFSKILMNITTIDKSRICSGKQKPTKHLITLKNGTTIHCLSCGDTGYGLMGFTIHLLIVDEAAFVPNMVYQSIIPALAVTRGIIWLLSTPYVKEGYYFDCFDDPSFTSFHTSSETCPRRDDIFLARQKKNLTEAQYAQWYLGKFVDDALQFFSDDLIRAVCVLKRQVNQEGDYFLGCDVGRVKDEFSYEIVKRIIGIPDNYYEQVESITTVGVPLPESARRIMSLNRVYDFRTEFIDSGGMGISIVDMLRESDADKRKVVEINNASRIYNREEGKKKIMKEELYHNLRRLMEQGRIKLLDDDEVKASLKSILAEHQDNGRLKIWGSDAHIAEGLIRACWCSQDKRLRPYIF